MKKTLFLTGALLLSLASLAQAKYTWTGAVDSDWSNQANWALDGGTSWKTDGPKFGASWLANADDVVLDGSTKNKHSADREMSIGGDKDQYSSKLTLQNGSIFKLTIKQNGGTSQLFGSSAFTVDASSKLTLDVKNSGRYNDQGDWVFNVKGYQGVDLIGFAFNGGTGSKFIMNLDAYGSMHSTNTPGAAYGIKLPLVFSGTLGYGSAVLAEQMKTGQFSLGLTSGNYEVMTRLLYDVDSKTNGLSNIESQLFKDLDGSALTKSDKNLAADAADLNKYYLYQDAATGDIKVEYLVDKSKSIPEPTTATLTLIGLVALLLRRRRA